MRLAVEGFAPKVMLVLEPRLPLLQPRSSAGPMHYAETE